MTQIYVHKSQQHKDFDSIIIPYKHDDYECKTQEWIRCGGVICEWQPKTMLLRYENITHLCEGLNISNLTDEDVEEIFDRYDEYKRLQNEFNSRMSCNGCNIKDMY